MAKEDGSEKVGESVLVLQLPASEEITAPKFKDAYYVVTYPESGSGLIDFQPLIAFANVDDPEDVKINLDSK